MKKILAIAFAAVMSAGVLMGCSSGASTGTTAATTAATEATTAAKTTFTVGFDQDFPPFGYVGEDGEFTGFDIDLAKEAASRMGYELILQPISWDAKDFELSSGAIDCIWNGFTINGREEGYTWTDAYMDNSQVVVVKKDSGISALADLKDKVVVAQTDSAALHVLESEDWKELTDSFKELVVSSQYNAAFMDLESGAVDAVALDVGVARYQIAGKEDQYAILDEILMDEQYGVGFLLGNTELRDKVQATLEEMVADGTFAEISNEWFGYDVGIIGKE